MEVPGPNQVCTAAKAFSEVKLRLNGDTYVRRQEILGYLSDSLVTRFAPIMVSYIPAADTHQAKTLDTTKSDRRSTFVAM